jgi:hypothetical protein
MGREARCMAEFGEWTGEGRLLLETDDLVFRGAARLKVPVREIRRVAATDGWLEVTHSGGVARFDLGSAAARWADAIRNPRSLLDKLGVKAGAHVAVVDLDDPDFVEQLRARTPHVVVVRSQDALDEARLDLVFYDAAEPAALDVLPALRERIAQDGAIWVVSPRGRPEIADVVVMAAARRSGLVDVKVARFSATHTSLKLVIPKAARR